MPETIVPLDAAKAVAASSFTAMVTLVTAFSGREDPMPFILMMIIDFGIPLVFFTSMIAVVRRGDCRPVADAMERIGILIFAVVFFELENLALPPGYNWASWVFAALFLLFFLAPCIIQRSQSSDGESGEGSRQDIETGVQHSNGDDNLGPNPTNISQELELAKAVIGLAFLAVVALVVAPTRKIILPFMSLWFLASGNFVAFSASLLWIWHSRRFPEFAKAMKGIGVTSIVLTFFVFLDLMFSSYRWGIWLSCAMLLLCLAPYNMQTLVSKIQQFITEKKSCAIAGLRRLLNLNGAGN